MERLKISENKRYFVKENGEPFVWMADTNWTMPQRMKWDDIDYFMKKRKSQGFSVLQIVALDPERDVKMRNPAGIKALIDDDLSKPNEQYFEYLDWIIDHAAEYGFYVLLLPVWGQLVVGDDWGGKLFDKTVTEDNAYVYGQWIGKRYGQRENVLWCLGGDRMPIHKGVDYRDVWRRMAEGLAKGVLGKDLVYNGHREEWKDLLLTFHVCHEMETGECSTFSQWTDEEAWIQFIMLQSGHGLDKPNFDLVTKEYTREHTMPVWDGEPAYEMMPTSWPVIKDFHGTWSVRKRAYWSLLAGSFGHTYGHASVWCSISEREKNNFTKYSWCEALGSEGSGQIKVLRDFMEAAKLEACVPDQSILADQANLTDITVDQHKQAGIACDHRTAYIYFPSGGSETLNLSQMDADFLHMWWFNPKDGLFYSADQQKTEQPVVLPKGGGKVFVSAPSCGDAEDWLLIVKVEETEPPVQALTYGEAVETGKTEKVFEW